MGRLVLHPTTENKLQAFSRQPAHAVLLSGAPGLGKGALASYLADLLLAEDSTQHPYVRRITNVEQKSIGIEAVRELEHMLSLKIPSSHSIARIIIIEDAHLLTIEAQNALLKTLEEPPLDTVLILTTSHVQALLPTVRSRLQTIAVNKPDMAAVAQHFADQVIEKSSFDQLLAISGGLPGLLTALLDNEIEHPLKEAVAMARAILQKSIYERLLLVDELAKRKGAAQDVCIILMQMAEVALSKVDDSAFKRWQIILSKAYLAHEQLLASGQPKLVLTNLMLQL